MTLVDKASFFEISEEMEAAHIASLRAQFEALQQYNREPQEDSSDELKALFKQIDAEFAQLKRAS